MANLRKLIAKALTTANLAGSDISETAVDRIAAMAGADALGSELWRLRLADDPRAYNRALLLLMRRSRPAAQNDSLRRKLCNACLREWLDTNCRACGGRGFILHDNVQRTCPACDGTTLRRYSDQWRMAQMGLDATTYRKWERRFALVHSKIQIADAGAWRAIAQHLGWIDRDTYLEMVDLTETRSKIRAALSEVPARTHDNNMQGYSLSSATGTD